MAAAVLAQPFRIGASCIAAMPVPFDNLNHYHVLCVLGASNWRQRKKMTNRCQSRTGPSYVEPAHAQHARVARRPALPKPDR
ncbi:hypothetical protein HPP92_019326 [Vanilla planifolia]|uniref:Uncharacterized protein n=1 Tax=Vanilla planifolia TaxID=51239 RepID=A0A835QC93_VANPL|nr:hypothetical protein HPP92_019326 [Vanilla planifolia]